MNADDLQHLGPESQSQSEAAEQQGLAKLPAYERLELIMAQVRFHQEMQRRTLTAEQHAARRAEEVAYARSVWGHALP
ncbi:MAG: hypothetical protein AAF645_28330 [Myxococcota bacterium]